MADASAGEGPGGGPGPPADGGTRRRPEAPQSNPNRASTPVAYSLEDGPIMVSPSFLHAASVEACTAMLTRYNPAHLLRKDVVAAGVQDALSNATGAIHTIQAVWKYTRDQKIICVKFSNPDSAKALIGLKTVDIAGAACSVSKYGERLVRIELARVPMHATVEELVSVVGHLGNVKSITRPLVHGFEDHLVTMTILPHSNANFVEEQKKVLRPAIFSGQSYVIQYRCLDETVVCTACKERGHFNGPKCPMVNRCLICYEEGHQRRNCPKKSIAPQQLRGGLEPQETAPTYDSSFLPAKEKPFAPPPPPGDPDNLQSTGLPPLGGSTWGSFNPGVSDIEMYPSSTPQTHRSSTRHIVSAERQNRLEKTIRGGKMQSEALREKMKERKRKEKDAKIHNHGPSASLMIQCVSGEKGQEEPIPQTDGPTDTPGRDAASHEKVHSDLASDAEIEAVDDSTEGSVEQSHGTGTDDVEKCAFKVYEDWKIQEIIDNQHNFLCCECGEKGCPNICLLCPIFPTTWCSKEHKCVSAQSQLAVFNMDVTDIPQCSDCSLIGMHTCNNDNYKRIPSIGFC